MTGNIDRLRLSWARACGLALALLYLAAPAAGFGGTPQLLRNINTAVVPRSSNPGYLGTLQGKMLFGAVDPSGTGLWSTDGTSTILLHRLAVEAQFSFPGTPNFQIIGNKGYFVAFSDSRTAQIWSTDGTAAGTTLVIDLGALSGRTSPVLLGGFGSQLIFSAADAAGYLQMYATDGTNGGTRVLTQNLDERTGVSNQLAVVGSKFYFATVGPNGLGNYPYTIWASDGTFAGTHAVTNPYGTNSSVGMSAVYYVQSMTALGNQVLYTSSGLLWAIDTSTDTLGALSSPGGQAGFGPPNAYAPLVNMGSYVVFLGSGGIGSAQLWRTDGTAAGTVSIAPASSQQYPLLQRVGNRVIFYGPDSNHNVQVWGSDGTTANTVQLTTGLRSTTAFPYPPAIFHSTVGGFAYFSLSDGVGTTTWTVWRTDGTVAGTRRAGGLPSVNESFPGSTAIAGGGSSAFVELYGPNEVTSLYVYDPAADRATLLKDGFSSNSQTGFLAGGSALYFSTQDPILGSEPWISDGTAAGTRLIANLYVENSDNDSSPDNFVELSGKLVFAADDGVNGRELWQSDGTAAGTALLADINTGPAASNPSHLLAFDGGVYFFATDANGKQSFMRVTGSPAVAQTLAADLAVPPASSPGQPPPCQSDSPVTLNGLIYFAAHDIAAGTELWSTDGTAAGTHMIADINAGAADSNPCYLTVFNNRVYFSATGPGGRELWTSDGTNAGTLQVLDIAQGTTGSYPLGLTVFGGSLYFGAVDSSNSVQLFKSDGFASGTISLGTLSQTSGDYLSPLGSVNGKLLVETYTYQPPPAGNATQLWATDGTSAASVNLNASPIGPVVITRNGLAYFSAPGTGGPEPWVSDGTPAGTHLLKDINATAQSSIQWFDDFRGIALFTVTGLTSGSQLWRSDGTAAGTTLISPVDPEFPLTAGTDSNRQRLALGNRFFFAATDPVVGNEPYVLTLGLPLAVADSATTVSGQQVTINVLANDTDSDGTLDASSVLVSTAAGHGTVTMGSSGALVYSPAAGYSGADTFAYTVRDDQGATSSPATVTVTVTAASAPPAGGGASSGDKGGGGGGSMNVLELLALLGFVAAQILRGSARRMVGTMACLLAAGCGGGGGGGGDTTNPPPAAQYSVGGSVSGLSGTGLQLQNGSGTPLAVSANGSFSFPATLTTGTSYSISVVTQPTGQTCTVAAGSGTVSGSNVSSIAVSCKANSYTLSGTVAGLANGATLVLENQGQENLKITTNGAFSFTTSVTLGAAYSVTVASQPSAPDQECNVSNGAGTGGSSDASGITVSCVTVIGVDSVGDVVRTGNHSVETLLQVAAFVAERLTFLSNHVAGTVTETCAPPYVGQQNGSAVYTFTDADGSGSLSAGDTVVIVANNCSSASLADHATGTVTVTLAAPVAGATFSASAVASSLKLADRTIDGRVDVDYTSQETAQSVRARAGTAPAFQIAYPAFQGDITTFNSADCTKAVDYTNPHYSLQIAAVFTSEALQGQFTISTPQAITGRFEIYPVAGMEQFSAGPSVLHYAARDASDNDYVSVSLDPTGSGTFSDVSTGQGGPFFWEQGFTGFPWYEPRGFGYVQYGSSPGYRTDERDLWGMHLLFTEPFQVDPVNQILSNGMDVNTPIMLYFSGPVDAANAALAFTANYVSTPQTIPADISVAGAIVTVRPHTQLQHGQSYNLQDVTPIPSTWSSASGAIVGMALKTNNNLQADAGPSPAVATPGQTVSLLSNRSFSTDSTIAHYSWTQTGGAAVTLNGASTATASFAVPVGAHAGDSLHFNLTITDAKGATDSVPVTVFVLTNLTQPFLYYRQQQGAAVGQTAELAVLESSVSGTTHTELGGTPDPAEDLFQFGYGATNNTRPSGDLLQFFTPGHQIVPNLYTNANTPGANAFFVQSWGFQCNNPAWTFTVYESVAAGDGTASRFAADFTQSCPGDAPPFIGSLRVNSTVPLP